MTQRDSAGHFVDRGRELAQLDAVLARAVDGEPSLVVVAADAGVGKTRLLAEFASRVAGHVLWGTCLPMGERGVPFAPIAEALRALGADPQLRERVPAALTPLVSDGSEPGRALSRSQLFQAILDLVEDLASREPTVLVVEDLHWADQSTRDLLTFLVPNLRSQRLLVVGSCRTDDLRRDHPLRPILAELARHPHVQRIDVPSFTPNQVADQLTYLTGRGPTAATLDLVMSRTQGNAYFVEELVAAGLDGRELPASLRELLLVRADVVPPPARRLLRIASLAESEVGDTLLAAVSGMPLDEVRAHLHEAIDAQLIVSTPGGVRFRHALLREALQQDLLAGERTEYHAAYARVLRARDGSGTSGYTAAPAQLAYHVQEAGEVAEAMGAWIAAATAAEAVFAFAEAHQHLSKALAAWDAVDKPERRAGMTRLDLLARAAEDAFLGGDAERACDLARTAISGTDEVAAPRVAGVLYERLSRYLRDTAERDQIYEMIERAVQLVPAAPPSVERARVLAGQAGRLSTLGRLREVRAILEEAVEMARAVGSALVECEALNTLGVVTCYLDDDAAGLAQIGKALELARACGDSQQQMRAYWNLAVCTAEAGRWEEAIGHYRAAIAALPRLGLAHLVPELYAYAAQDLVTLGRWDEAQALVDEVGSRDPSHRDNATAIELLVGRGDVAEARRVIAAMSERDIFTDEEDFALVMVNLAELETWEGNVAAARTAVDAALGHILDSDRPIAAARALTVALRCEADAADEARARRKPDDVERARARAATHLGHIREIVARSGPQRGWKREVRVLAAVCDGEWARADGGPDPAAWSAAVRGAREMSMAYVFAYAQTRHGEAVMAATGDRDRAARELRGAHQAACSLGAQPLRELIERLARRARIDIGVRGASDTAFGLTPREREVLGLVAQGASNRQIARTLFISEKTASVHVSNIIRKLGASSRGEAAAVAYRAGLISQ